MINEVVLEANRLQSRGEKNPTSTRSIHTLSVHNKHCGLPAYNSPDSILGHLRIPV